MSDRSPDQIAFTNQATAIYDPTTGANYGAKPNTGYSDADFFLGAASSYSQNKNAPFNSVRLQEYDSYIQDNWRVSPSLTLNVGLRWEAHPAPRADNDYMVTFDMKNNAMALPQPLDYYVQNGLTTQALVTNLQNLGVKFETLQQGGLPSQRLLRQQGELSCRASASPIRRRSARKGTVIRGGYGEYIYPVPVRNSVRYLTAELSVHRRLFAELHLRAHSRRTACPTTCCAARRP